ncbi:MAG: Nif3-like dinuclear metal center hexameric protein [Bdellovibrionales bacterium]|nr:Nif3-like dinuclear metal center hexameric protein [Bdellovibrionales bacterium]
MIINKNELNKFFNELLNPHDFSDYGPNGLQIDGKEDIQKVTFSVSATRHSVEKSVELKSDALVVHHGLFWNFHGAKTITGPFAKRIKPLIENNINLWGYHLPLDAHLEVGNAASLAKKLALEHLISFGDYKGSPTGISGQWSRPRKAKELKNDLEKILGRSVLHAPAYDNREIKNVGIITGGANSEWKLAVKNSLDAYITGEMSEHDWHESSESDIHMFAGGHHATERLGPLALMEAVKNKFNIECEFIDSENPA